MANDDHIALLKKGVAAWNAWRDENPSIHPHLSEAMLSGANLLGADLRQANLSKANVSEAYLGGAMLANLSWAQTNLSGPNFREANLGQAQLNQANLSGADLSGAKLSKADPQRGGPSASNAPATRPSSFIGSAPTAGTFILPYSLFVVQLQPPPCEITGAASSFRSSSLRQVRLARIPLDVMHVTDGDADESRLRDSQREHARTMPRHVDVDDGRASGATW